METRRTKRTEVKKEVKNTAITQNITAQTPQLKKRTVDDKKVANKKNIRGTKKNSGVKPKPKIRTIIWRIWCVLFVMVLIGSAAAGVILTSIFFDARNDLVGIDFSKVETPETTKVFDMNDELVADLAEDALIMVTYDQIPESLKDAFMSVEDARFLTHKGIDGPRTLSAILDSYVFKNGVSGGSTLTQQLVRNTLLMDKIAKDATYKKSEQRKIDEWILSYELEKKMDKNEIFTAYVNNAINYGRFTGVGTAARRYFNKSVSELTVAESALLAGIPQLPLENNPYEHIDTATSRFNMVIDSMYRHNFIMEAEADAMRNIPLADLVIRNQEDFLNPHTAYFSAIEKELQEIFDEDEEEETTLRSYYRNYKIFTHLNQEQQQFANEIMDTENYVDWEDAVYNTYGAEHTEEEALNFQGAFTVVNTKDGGIPAIGAARNIKKTNGVNIAVEGYKSPGSSIKPIIDYAPLVEKFDWASNHIMNDKVTYYSGTNSQVYNYNQGGYKGFVTMEKAIADSLNTTAVQAMQLVGVDYAVTKAAQMGLTRAKPLLDKGLIGEASALGGGLEATTKEMAGAYATMGNAGYYNKPHIIKRIENMEGEVVYEYNPEQKQILKESTAATMTEALIYTRQNGTPASGARKQVGRGVNFAAKTGTSSYSQGEISEYGVSSFAEKDHWIVGYSPEFSIAGWTGLAVEGEDVLRRTGGNSNDNKGVGSYMIAAWMNEFAPTNTSFDFINAANRGKTGGIGNFELTNKHDSSTVSWTSPGLDYPGGLSADDKATLGTLVFDVVLNTESGSIPLATATTKTSLSYSGDASRKGITSITVTARLNNEQAQIVMPPVSATVSAKTKEAETPEPPTKPVEKPDLPTEPIVTG
ncbi:hypothetical protein AwErysi_05800 [Erysipelotrichaceae bacterium]|nr:hypothetical protein AwErysi_05800 [Erysipelotrichaceae bacterium]